MRPSPAPYLPGRRHGAGRFLLSAFVLWSAFPVHAEEAPSALPGLEVEAGLAGDCAKLMREEEAKARKSAWIWGALAGVSAGYAGYVFAGKNTGEPVLTYVSLVAVVAGGVGLVQGILRAREADGLARGFESAPGPAGTVRVGPANAAAFERDLSSLELGARDSARSTLRSGCVVPVLLSGVAVFGLVQGGDSGDQLAGICLGGALAIGGPSMLSYWGLRDRLDRYQSLMTRWKDSVHKGEDKTR
jgi:hypothetical protein